MRYEAVIFDLDGTLINSIDDLADSCNEMLTAYDLPNHDVEAYKYFVGNGIGKLVERALPIDKSEDRAFYEKALAKFKEIYNGKVLNKTRAYSGVRELLLKLVEKDVPMAVCTNKPMDAAKTIISILFEPGTFKIVMGDRPGHPRKPDPSTCREICKEIGVEPEKVVYVGDSGVDMQTAVNAGFLPVGARWGFRKDEELLKDGAKLLLDKPTDLLFEVQFKK
ncbi:HAD family hydrolase [Anaerovibrio lipolyticus]|uniref:HAD family hydrolase n=1 Tax=Anaerovibrio lipolyticus TaxID=82374 RepID=UPI0026F08DEF|nr:HAD family hydrolase [Anaerovibrio lipolyticus]MBE6105499.1 HAD family hydrolase [Anaerovibrio lipolyticus]